VTAGALKTTTATTTVPRRSQRIAARVVDGQALLVVIDAKQLHTLNGVGTRVWELCDGRDVEAIVSAIVDEYAVTPEVAAADVQRFVSHLAQLGAITLDELR
jgi:hypothetical protein